MREGKRSERFSWCEHRWRGDGKIIESRLSHRRTKEIFHRPTNFLAKWPCIKIAEEKRKIERERERGLETKTKIAKPRAKRRHNAAKIGNAN